MNVKNLRLSIELGQNLSRWQIYSSTESSGERSKRISSNVYFNVVRDLNSPLGVINYGENICFFNPVIQVLYFLPVFRDYIKKFQSPAKGVSLKIRKLFMEIETLNDPLRTSNHVRYLNLQRCEPGIYYDAHESLPKLLAKAYPNINNACMLKINKQISKSV